MAYTHLDPGQELEVSTHTYFHPESADLSALVSLSLEELKQLEQESVKLEEAIYSRVLDTVQEWTKQAGRTLDLRKAQEYLKIRPVNHTSNRWVVDESDWHEISNMVYKLRWRISERTAWNKTAQKSLPVSWAVSWYLSYNTTHNPDYSGPGHRIAGQSDKRYAEKAALEKYLQGRIATYAHLFTEISPPIPEEARRRFCVNGVLLSGYTVETPQPTKPNPDTVDDLLSYLDDDDMSDLLQIVEQEPPAETPPLKPAHKKPPPHKHRNSTLTR